MCRKHRLDSTSTGWASIFERPYGFTMVQRVSVHFSYRYYFLEANPVLLCYYSFTATHHTSEVWTAGVVFCWHSPPPIAYNQFMCQMTHFQGDVAISPPTGHEAPLCIVWAWKLHEKAWKVRIWYLFSIFFKGFMMLYVWTLCRIRPGRYSTYSLCFSRSYRLPV